MNFLKYHQSQKQKERKINANIQSFFADFRQGAFDISPLSIAVLPWGILAGSMAIQAGLTVLQAFSMSAMVFAGAAQLVTLSLFESNASIITILLTIFVLTSQHYIYALNLRSTVSQLPFRQRLTIGFLLTDELFAVAIQNKKLNFPYLLGAGLCFYLAWCIFSIIGIFLAYRVSNLENLNLDFSIIAILILIVVPLVKNLAVLAGVLITVFFACIFKSQQFEFGMLLSALFGMLGSVCIAKLQESR